MNLKLLRRRGFTLIELLVVIAIIAILAAATMPMIPAMHDQARVATCEARLAQIGVALKLYAEDHRAYPVGLQTLYDGRYLEQERLMRCDKTGAPFVYLRPTMTAARTAPVASCMAAATPPGQRPHRHRSVSVELLLNGETRLTR